MIEDYLRWREEITKALDPAFYPIDWLDEQILQQRALIIAVDDGCVVIEIRNYPGGAREVHGLVAAGNIKTIVDVVIPAVEAFGREHGCRWACCESKAAWSRLLKPSGYQTFQVTLRKEL